MSSGELSSFMVPGFVRFDPLRCLSSRADGVSGHYGLRDSLHGDCVLFLPSVESARFASLAHHW